MDQIEQISKMHAWSLRNYARINRRSVEPGRDIFEFGYLMLWLIRHWSDVENFVDRALDGQDAEYLVSQLCRGPHGVRSRYVIVLDALVDSRKTNRLDEHVTLSALVRYTEAWEPDEQQVRTVFFMAEAMRAMSISSDLIPSDESVRARIASMFIRWSQEAVVLFDEIISPKYGSVQDILTGINAD